MKVEEFDTWELAFDACREEDYPIVVRVDGEIRKIFPSGSSQTICN